MSPSNPEHATASVSVIVPSYNCGRFIAAAIDSILAQTLQPEQIVIVDDGSTDETELVVRRYANPRLQYIKQPHAGAAATRNAGLNAARCEYVAFLDADDRWRPIFVEQMHGYLAEDPTVACAFSNFVWFQHATGALLRDQFQSYPELRRPVLLRDEPYAHGLLPKERAFSALVAGGEIPAYMQVMMFRRSAIETTRFEETLVHGQDIHFALRTFMLGGVVFTDAMLAEVRQQDTDTPRGEIAIHTLDALKALEPHVTRDTDLTAYRDRLIKAYLDAAVYQITLGQVGRGWRTYRNIFGVAGSPLRKLKGSLRVAVVLGSGVFK